MTPDPPRRVSLRLPNFDYSQEGAYFVTICVNGRAYLFGEIVDGEMNLNEYGEIVAATWDDLPSYNAAIGLDAFVVMPNHVHGIIVIMGVEFARPDSGSFIKTGEETPPLQKTPSLGQIVGYYKYQTTSRINALMNASGSTIWQRGYYEHVIRDETSLNRLREYITYNPLRWHLDRENPQALEKDSFDSGWHRSREGLTR